MIISDTCGWMLVILAGMWTVWQVPSRSSRTPMWWRTIVVGAVIAFRWPALGAPYDFSPDESQSLAGALTLIHDPRFWISVDGATAGPLHFFAEIPAALFPAAAIYFAERILAVLFVIGTVFLVGVLLRAMGTTQVAETVELTAAAAFGLSRAVDFQYVSTELVGITLLAGAIVLAFTNNEVDSGSVRRFVVGLLLGAAPFAKLQLGPLATVLGIYLAIRAVTAQRSIMALVAGAATPAFVAAGYLSLTQSWDHALIPYFFSNVEYTGDTRMGVIEVATSLLRDFWNDVPLGSWLVVGAGIVATGALAQNRGRQARRAPTTVAIAGFMVAAVCVFIPRRPFPHYTYLLAPFWVFLVGRGLARLAENSRPSAEPRGRRVIAACLIAWCVPLMADTVAEVLVPPPVPYLAVWHHQNERMAELIAKYTRRGDSMAIWGIRSDLFVVTKLRQAVPQAHSELQIWANQWQHYYLRTYAEAFDRNRPAVFVDAVGPGNFLFTRRAEAHEAFPYLAAVVRSKYTLLADLHGTRIYVRKDRIPASSPPSAASPHSDHG